MITEQLIRRQSGEYDCEVVSRVKLEGFGCEIDYDIAVLIVLGIRTITNLENCINLVDLSLARNEVQLLCMPDTC